jgi:hypothetical protein
MHLGPARYQVTAITVESASTDSDILAAYVTTDGYQM